MYVTFDEVQTAISKQTGELPGDDNMVQWMSECQFDICSKIAEVRQDFFRKKSTLAVIAGTDSYDLSGLTPAPDNLLRIRRIEDSDKAVILPKDLNAADYDETMGWHLIGTSQIVFEPTPVYSVTYTIYFIDLPAKPTAVSDTIDARIPTNYRKLFLYYGKWQWYDSEDCGDDPELAIYNLNLYSQMLRDMLAELDTEEAWPTQVEVVPDGLN